MLGRSLAVSLLALGLATGCSRGAGGGDAAPAAGSASAPETTTSTTSTTESAPGSTPATVGRPAEAVGEVVHGSIATPDGRTRTYRLYLPTTRAPDAPLLLALHGGTGNGDQYAASSGYDELAEGNGVVVAYAEGTPTAMGERRLVWNAGGCCAAAVRDGVDDVGFLVALIDQLAAEHDLDPTRVLVTGHSNGAMMGLRLACEAADRVAAVAVQAGTVFVDDCAPSEPVSVLDLHGTEDRNLPLAGGVGSESLVGVDFPPVRDGLAAIARANGCAEDEQHTVRSPGLIVESAVGCPDGIDVELMAVEGADHAWMADASVRLWSFLSTHRG